MQIEYKNIDPKLVVNEIRNGRSLESVQKVFGLKFKSEVQDLYLKGLMEMGEIPQVEFNKPVDSLAVQSPEIQDRTLFRKRERLKTSGVQSHRGDQNRQFPNDRPKRQHNP